MPLSPAASPLYDRLFGDNETAECLDDRAEVEAMLAVEAALAEVQGALGVIPTEAAALLGPACRGLDLDPAALAVQTGVDGVPVPALLAATRKALGGPEHSQYLHWGATSQDIMDTALALRLKRLLSLWEGRLDALLHGLAELAESHAELPMAARTYGQAATPTSFGALVASWGRPLLRHRARLQDLKPDLLLVSLSGAAGTLSAMGPKGPEVRAALAQALGLSDPGHSWHAEREGVGAFATWMAGLVASLGKMGEDLLLLTQTGIGEVALEGAGGSSTMPQKQNPVGPSVLVALARQANGLAAVMMSAGLHRQQRDGAAWFTEWLALPPLCLTTGRALALSLDLCKRIRPDPLAMGRGLSADNSIIHAEALSFALAQRMPRPEAQVLVKSLCEEAAVTSTDLRDLVTRKVPGLTWNGSDLGQAPAEARAFAKAAYAI